jgi:hypothetical protein
MLFFLAWIGFAVGVGALAQTRERNGFGWFVLAAVASPLVAVIILLLVGEGRMGRCPSCRERVKLNALVCPHCRSDMPPAPPPKPIPDSKWRSGSALRG